MELSTVNTYYDRFDEGKNYERLLFSPNKPLQSAELNEIQSTLLHHIKGIGSISCSNGDILRDCGIVVDEYTGTVNCESGAIYIEGLVRGVKPSTLVVPITGTVFVGVYLKKRVITELEDTSLYNPAIGTRGEGDGGSARLKAELTWGFSTDGQEGDFYPVHTITDGVLRLKEAPPTLDNFTKAIEKYDRDSSGGTYIVEGLRVLQASDTEDGKQVYTVSEGRARVDGKAIELPVSRRLTKKINPDLLEIDSEPHLSITATPQKITLDRYPVGQVTQVRITQETTEKIVHGSYSGCSDPLKNTSVIEIIKVEQGGVVYTPSTDYKLTASKVDWSPKGQEPPPHSTYTVTYRHITKVEPTDVTLSGLTVSDAVLGSQILVSYTQMLPRVDKLCISKEGEFTWIEGVAASWNPQSPHIPGDMLPIATVRQTWDEKRTVQNDGVVSVSMDKIASFEDRMDEILVQTAQTRLAMDALTREAGAKKGLWVDPCLDDSMRDPGLEQSAVIVSNAITLPVELSFVSNLPKDVSISTTIDYSVKPFVEQLLRTGSMKVNPYHSFDPLPALVNLTPAIDRWTDVQTKWDTPLTQVVTPFSRRRGFVRENTHTSVQVLSNNNNKIAYLRQIDVSFKSTGFAKNEEVEITFDGLPVVTKRNKADENGVFEGTFKIPPNVPAGSKLVDFKGKGGTKGSAIFVGQGTLNVQTLRNVVTTVLTWHDPLAQTFISDSTVMAIGVDLWFTAVGTSKVVVQIRETNLGIPTQTVLSEKILDPKDIVLDDNPTRVIFENPALIPSNSEHAIVVMCDDGVTSLYIAELGKSDPFYGQWVMSQPYQVGVLLSSSNSSTWTPHQDKDLTFRLLKADFSASNKEIPLGEVEATGITDLLVLGISEQPSAETRVEYFLSMPDKSNITLSDMQPARFTQPISGKIGVTAKLSGSSQMAPILHSGTQILAGSTKNIADYITRAISAGKDTTVKVIFEAFLPSGSDLKVSMGDGTKWEMMEFDKSQPLDEGWQELIYKAKTNDLTVHIKLELSGSPTARPMVTNVRIITI